mmetsp:Transcript_80640/g.133508  ORF Transcript_80640/g.133508 Transcript_80640/m.133508 type:complete len:178 (-) Transcript_80640:78-611(-)
MLQVAACPNMADTIFSLLQVLALLVAQQVPLKAILSFFGSSLAKRSANLDRLQTIGSGLQRNFELEVGYIAGYEDSSLQSRTVHVLSGVHHIQILRGKCMVIQMHKACTASDPGLICTNAAGLGDWSDSVQARHPAILAARSNLSFEPGSDGAGATGASRLSCSAFATSRRVAQFIS